MKLPLALEPFWAIQNECSRQIRMAIHLAVRNDEYQKKKKINLTNETRQGGCLCNCKYMSKRMKYGLTLN